MPASRLILGDCLKLMKGLDAASVDLVATDPPYFRVKDAAWDRQWADAEAFLAWLSECVVEWSRLLRPDGSLYVFASPQMASRVEEVVRERMTVLNHIVWSKAGSQGSGPWNRAHKEGLRAYFPQTERIIFAEQAKTSSPLQAVNVGPAELRRPFFVSSGVPYTDVWSFPPVGGYEGKHPCEKPLALMDHIVAASSRPGAVVLDSFMGSGVTGLAALRAGREFIGMEKDPAWFEVARARLEAPQFPRRRPVKEAHALPLFGVSHLTHVSELEEDPPDN